MRTATETAACELFSISTSWPKLILAPIMETRFSIRAGSSGVSGISRPYPHALLMQNNLLIAPDVGGTSIILLWQMAMTIKSRLCLATMYKWFMITLQYAKAAYSCNILKFHFLLMRTLISKISPEYFRAVFSLLPHFPQLVRHPMRPL